MSRHRNVRGMDYGDDYEGYDDVYGHSVEEDYGVSPSTAEQFLFHRGLHQHQLASFLEEGEEDVGGKTDDGLPRRDSEKSLGDSNNFQKLKLSDIEEARLQSCLEEIRNVVGETILERTMIEAVLANNFSFEKSLNAILDQQESQSSDAVRRNNNNMETQRGVCALNFGKFESKQQTKSQMKTNTGKISKKKITPSNVGIRSNFDSSKSLVLELCDSQETLQEDSEDSTGEIFFSDTDANCETSAAPERKSQPNIATTALSDLVGSNTSQTCPNIPSEPKLGVTRLSSVPLAALASAHLSSSPKQNVVIQGQGSPSLSQLAESHLEATKSSPNRGVLQESSLSDLVRDSNLSTPPKGLPSKLTQKSNQGISLSDLASLHLSSEPPDVQSDPCVGTNITGLKTSTLPKTLKGLNSLQPSIKTALPLPSVSLPSFASSHLTANPPQGHPKGISSITGVSLAHLASAHLNSSTLHSAVNTGTSNVSPMSSPQRNVQTQPVDLSNVSLSDLAATHLSQTASKSSAFGPPKSKAVSPKDVLRNVDKISLGSNKNETTKKPSLDNSLKGVSKTLVELGKVEAPHFVKPSPGFAFIPLTSKELPLSEQSELKTRVRTPPGFPSRTTLSEMDVDCASPTDIVHLEDSFQHFDQTSLATDAPHTSRKRFCLFANPSVFGRAICTKYIDQSRELSHRQGVKVASYVFQKQHSRPSIHRQFSYQRQRSWGTGRDSPEQEIVPFDFAIPSPDDVAKERQLGAFGRNLQR